MSSGGGGSGNRVVVVWVREVRKVRPMGVGGRWLMNERKWVSGWWFMHGFKVCFRTARNGVVARRNNWWVREMGQLGWWLLHGLRCVFGRRKMKMSLLVWCCEGIFWSMGGVDLNNMVLECMGLWWLCGLIDERLWMMIEYLKYVGSYKNGKNWLLKSTNTI